MLDEVYYDGKVVTIHDNAEFMLLAQWLIVLCRFFWQPAILSTACSIPSRAIATADWLVSGYLAATYRAHATVNTFRATNMHSRHGLLEACSVTYESRQ